jgi:hypothetical protein
MGKRVMEVLMVAAFVLTACGSSGNTPGSGATSGGNDCPPAPTPLATSPEFPENFPVPGELVLTSEEKAGPSTIVEGYWESDLTEVYNEFKDDAFPGAGYDVTFSEQEATDAEVNFSGGSTTGQVKLEVECEGRTHVKITIRPA